MFASGGESTQLATLDVRQHGRKRYVPGVDTDDAIQQRAIEVSGRADTGRAVEQLTRFLLGQCHKIRERLCRKICGDHQHRAGGAERRDWLKPRQLIDTARRIEADASRKRTRGVIDQERIAIGRCIGDEFGGDRAARTGAIFDDDRLTENLCHRVEEHARNDVRDAARPERNDHVDAARGVVVCPRGADQREHRGDRGGGCATHGWLTAAATVADLVTHCMRLLSLRCAAGPASEDAMAEQSTTPSQIKLAVFMHGNSNYHIAGWRHPDAYTDSAENLARWAKFAQTMERGKMDMLFIADSVGIYGVG
ncbi:MAG TPA: hypothetical protein VL976_12885, partial [Xanthobacteraceae bacterium]|nr:hypothetical protein [Xanthobacteraceae bacterium]